MKNIFNEKDRSALLKRLENMDPSGIPQWGKMNAHQVIVHLTDPFRCAMGERKASKIPGLFSKWPINKLIVYILPWPKGAPTAPEFIQGVKGTPPETFEKDKKELFSVIEKFVSGEKEMSFQPSPVFGKITNKDWGRLMWRHVNHHLKQFGL